MSDVNEFDAANDTTEPVGQPTLVNPDDPHWDELDAQDWREDGPFDLEEVECFKKKYQVVLKFFRN